MDIELLEERARIVRTIRNFFEERNYLELDTPLLAPNLIPETCLEVFETSYIKPESGGGRRTQNYWLIPSPEIWMKKIIARHRRNIFQICKCFRNGESTGRLHSPEFTMLEYYTVGADYTDSLRLTEELFGRLLPAGSPPRLSPPFLSFSMEEAFSRWAGADLFEADPEAFRAKARSLGLDPRPGAGIAELYDLIFIHAVEPRLPRDRPVVLTDYPAFVPCLAQKRAGGKSAERWELYIEGIELANCYSEETSAETVRAYFEREGKLKERDALVPHGVDPEYHKIFGSPGERDGEKTFPRCSGVALGVDRLVMALCGFSSIDSVLPFPMTSI